MSTVWLAAPLYAAGVAGAAALAARLLPSPRPLRDRAVAAALLALFLPIAEVRVLGALGALTPLGMAATLALVSALAVALSGARARSTAALDLRAALSASRAVFFSSAASATAWVGVVALSLAALAAYLLPPWHWDALNYHLPIVYDAVRAGRLRDVPTHIPFTNAYPFAVELFLIAARLTLGADTMLDFGQAPFALLGCLAIAGLARRAGASRPRAGAFGALFLAVPLVMLQAASSYVDLAVAGLLVAAVYFATGPVRKADLALFGVAAGLLLGSKPSTPPAVVLLAALVLVRAGLRGRLRAGLAALALVALVGGERYAKNAVEHQNPIWPIALNVGPWSLPGPAPAGPMFVLGLPPEVAKQSWPVRLAASTVAQPSRYIYDMRLGGLGPLVAFGLLPLALLTLRRADRRSAPALLLAVVSVASPAAHWMRYSLALPAAFLLHVAATTERLSPRRRAAADLALAALGALGVWQASRGFTDGGPSLARLLAMTPYERLTAVTVDDREDLWRDVRPLVRPGEAFAFDGSFTFPGQLWNDDPTTLAVFLDERRTVEEVDAELARARVRIVVAGDGRPLAQAVERARSHYRWISRCPLDKCHVFERLDP